RSKRDWSSDVCSSDLGFVLIALLGQARPTEGAGAAGAPMGLSEENAWLARVGPDGFERLLSMLFAEMKFDVDRSSEQDGLVDLRSEERRVGKEGRSRW